MPIKLIKRGDWFHLRGTHHGMLIRERAGTTDRREAEAVREKREREIYDFVVLGQDRKRSFAEAVAGYLDAGGEERFMLPVLDAYKNRSLVDLRQPDVDEAADKAYPSVAPSTRTRQFYTPFIAVMNYAAEQGWVPVRKWRKPSQPEGRLDWRTPQEIEAFILAAPWHVARNAIILIGSMMRASEAVHLDREDTSPDGHELTLWHTKKEYPRRVEVLSRAAPLISEVEHGAIIRTNNPFKPRYHAYDALNQAFRRVSLKAGLKPFSCHVLRHTGATWRYAMDSDLPRLQLAGGWKSIDMAMRYTHVSSRGLKDQLERYGWLL
jgi:integrase